MRVASPALAPILRSDAQGRLLAELFADPEAERSVTSVATAIGVSLPTALREVDRLVAAEYLVERRTGRTRLLRPNTAHPLYRALRQIVLYCYGQAAARAAADDRLPEPGAQA
jgi:hypothetical protein